MEAKFLKEILDRGQNHQKEVSEEGQPREKKQVEIVKGR